MYQDNIKGHDGSAPGDIQLLIDPMDAPFGAEQVRQQFDLNMRESLGVDFEWDRLNNDKRHIVNADVNSNRRLIKQNRQAQSYQSTMQEFHSTQPLQTATGQTQSVTSAKHCDSWSNSPKPRVGAGGLVTTGIIEVNEPSNGGDHYGSFANVPGGSSIATTKAQTKGTLKAHLGQANLRSSLEHGKGAVSSLSRGDQITPELIEMASVELAGINE